MHDLRATSGTIGSSGHARLGMVYPPTEADLPADLTFYRVFTIENNLRYGRKRGSQKCAAKSR